MGLSFTKDFYPRMLDALAAGMPPKDAQELVRLADKVQDDDAALVANQIRALMNSADKANNAKSADIFKTFLSGKNPRSVEPAPSGRPPAPVSTVGVPLPTGRIFPPGTVAYGNTTGAPPWLAGVNVHEIIHDFGAGNGINGTGVHLGKGIVLTAGHVAVPSFGSSAEFSDKAFVGHQPYDYGAFVHFLPPKSKYRGLRITDFLATSFGNWNDFALLSLDAKKDSQSAPGFRSIHTLQKGERLWVVGDKTGENIRVSVGAFSHAEGVNAMVKNVVIEGGFSGSPVMDDQGNVVGITSVRMDNGDLVMVTIDAIADALADHAPDSYAAQKINSALQSFRA